MPGYTIHFSVATEAGSAWEAVNEVERKLNLLTDSLLGLEVGLEINTEGVTDEMGEWCDLEEQA